jgi:hypothetical protein
MSRLRELALGWRGLLLYAGGAAALFLCWRAFGLPSPGLEGRAIPLCWLIAAFVSARSRPHPAAIACLIAACAASAFWRAGSAVLLVLRISAVAGLLPALVAGARGRLGTLAAVLPLAPLTILLVPFTGDEPTNVALAESIIEDFDLDTSNNIRQMDAWSPVQPEIADREDISHHMPLFSLLLLPGLPFGAAGIRVVCLLVSAGAGYAVLRLLKRAGAPDPWSWAVASMVFLPGAGVLGLAYADWTAVGLICLGALASRGRSGLVWSCLFALALAALKLRYAAAGAGLVLAAVLERPRKQRALLFAGAAAVALAVLAADYLVLGGRFFWIRYGNMATLVVLFHRTFSSAGQIILAPFWALIDSEAGLLWRAPWIILVPAGYSALRNKAPGLSRSLLLASVLYAVSLFLWMPDFWHSMPTPSGRTLLPILPFAVACAAFSGRRGRLLLVLSAVPAAAAFGMPLLRFNAMDGCDRLFSELGPAIGPAVAGVFPSVVRPDTVVVIAWTLAASAFAALLYSGRERAAAGFAALCITAAFAIAPRLSRWSWEAEDLPSDYRIGCALYPESGDPLERFGWPGSVERLLRLSDERDAVLLPVPAGTESVEVSLTLRAMSTGAPVGVEVLSGRADTVCLVSTRLAPLPAWLSRLKGRQQERSLEPGNLTDTTLVFRLPSGGAGMVAIRLARPSPGGPLDGLYLDRIEVR